MSPEEKVTRKLSAILSADVKGYSILMSNDEAFTVETLKSYRILMSDLIKLLNGRVVDAPGDNMLAEFASVVDAVQCAVKIQKALKKKNKNLPKEKRLEFRIGVNIGDVIQDGESLYGEGINIAARIEGLAEPAGVCISRNVYDQIKNKLEFGYEYIGEHNVKNIQDPVRVYKVLMKSEDKGKIIGEKSPFLIKKWIFSSAAIILAVTVAIIWQYNMGNKESVETPTIAVLPFDNMSGDESQEYFSDGVTEDIITDLSKSNKLFVISRNSTFSYKRKAKTIPEIAKELKVRYVLEGSVRRLGNRVRINAQLIDAEKDHHIWSERFDDTFQNIFDLQDKITGKIVSALSVKLSFAEENNIYARETQNIAAYESFLKGKEHFHKQTPDDWIMAVKYFEHAIKIDPNYSRAYAALGQTYQSATNLAFVQFFKELNMDWRILRLKAVHYLKLSMKHPTFESYRLAATIEIHRRNFEEAVAYAEKGLSINPNSPDSNLTLGFILVLKGDLFDGINYLEKAISLEPAQSHSMGTATSFIGIAYFSIGEFKEAVKYLEKGLEYNPELHHFSHFLAAAYAHLDQPNKAKLALERFLIPYGQKSINIQQLYYGWPFKNSAAFDYLAQGIVKAGIPGDPSNYYKVLKENKITGVALNEMIEHHQRGKYPGGEWWTYSDDNGELLIKDVWRDDKGNLHENNDKYKKWIEGDMCCYHFEKNLEGHTNCSEYYKNPDGTPEMKNEYIAINYFTMNFFSLED